MHSHSCCCLNDFMLLFHCYNVECVFLSVHCRLMLQFDISDVTREGIGVCCQLMMGQSSVPHYQQLEEFTARLAPGEVSLLVCMHVHVIYCIPMYLQYTLVLCSL